MKVDECVGLVIIVVVLVVGEKDQVHLTWNVLVWFVLFFPLLNGQNKCALPRHSGNIKGHVMHSLCDIMCHICIRYIASVAVDT